MTDNKDETVAEVEPAEVAEISEQTRELAAAQEDLDEPAEVTYAREFGPHDRQDLVEGEEQTLEASVDAMSDHLDKLDGGLPIVEDPGAALMRIVDSAVQSAQPIEVIERLLVVHERLLAAEARKAYNTAMAALRGEMPAIVKTDTVDYKTSKGQVTYQHENLANIVEDLGPVMAKHGLSFRWKTDTAVPQSITVTCIVTHADGHSEEAELSGPPDTSGSKNAIQAIASTVSYLQRYTLKAAIGIAAGKDDDGQGGAPAQRPAADHEPMGQPRAQGEAAGDPQTGSGGIAITGLADARTLFSGNECISNNQIGRLRNLAGKNGWDIGAIDTELARELDIKVDQIPALGDSYESIVDWFQRIAPRST